MKISFFGSSLVSAYWNGAATYYRGILRGLSRRGHTVTFYEPDAYDRQRHRDIDDSPYARVHVFEPSEAGLVRALKSAAGSDVIIKASGMGVLDGMCESWILDLKHRDNLIIFWDLDAPATLDRIDTNRTDPFRCLVPEYDLVFTYGGGEPVVKAYKSHGARHCIPIYNGLDPDVHYHVPPNPQFICDLAFMGNRLPDREQRVEEFFVKPATLLPHRRFLLGGNGWQSGQLPCNVSCLGHVYTREHNAFNCTPLAVLNVNRESMARYGHSPATRVFEAAGAGACIITDQWEGVNSFFEPEDEWLIATSGDEVAQRLEALSPERARVIGLAAQKRALAEHTYTQRAQLVEDALEMVKPCEL